MDLIYFRINPPEFCSFSPAFALFSKVVPPPVSYAYVWRYPDSPQSTPGKSQRGEISPYGLSRGREYLYIFGVMRIRGNDPPSWSAYLTTVEDTMYHFKHALT
jgi:hypothetical protein